MLSVALMWKNRLYLRELSAAAAPASAAS